MDEERDLEAAERALGHAPLGAETPAEAEARAAWDARLAPLLGEAGEVEPPETALRRAEARIDDEDRGAAEVVELRKSVSRWRFAAGAALAIAAALAIYIAAPSEPNGSRYVAVVTADDDGRTGLIIHFDTGTGVATVVPAGAAPPQGAAYEMWHLPEGETRLVSLGLVPQNASLTRSIAAGPGDIFAISQEPPGGSPSGQPTQPLYHGTVVRAD